MKASTSWQFEALGTTFMVVSDCPLSTSKLEVLLAGYQAWQGQVDTRYEFRQVGASLRLVKNGRDIYEDDADDTLNYFLLDLYRCLGATPRKHWLLHAAAVVRQGQVLVLAGPSNAGKSTMTRGLLRRGWSYLSEEMVSLGPDHIDALRRPLHLEAPEQVDGIAGFTSPCRIESGLQAVWVAAPQGPRAQVLSIGAIVRLYYQPRKVTSLVPLKASQALIELWQCRMNAGLQTAEIAATMVRQLPCYRLIAANETSGLESLVALCEQ